MHVEDQSRQGQQVTVWIVLLRLSTFSRIQAVIADISLEEDENCAFDYLELREDRSRGARYVFTESAPRPIQSESSNVRLSVCGFVCLSVPSREIYFPGL